jgi:hypothetical protein
LRKTVIYLDQFAVSNMMIALNPSKRTHANAQISPLWLKIYNALNDVCRQQLAVCPSSNVHVRETLAAEYGRSIWQVITRFSHQTSFKDSNWVLSVQLCEYARAWASGKQVDWTNPDINPVTEGNPCAWWRSLPSDTESLPAAWSREPLKSLREYYYAHVCEWWDRYKKQPRRPFEDLAAEEYDSMVQWLLRNNNCSEVMMRLHAVLEEPGVPRAEVKAKSEACLLSPGAKEIPWLRVHSLVNAGIVHRAASSTNRKPPNRGLLDDIEAVATYLPYCDAVVVDGDFKNLLGTNPVRNALNTKTHVFSGRTAQLKALLAFLSELENGATPSHKKLVTDLYGQW